MGFVLLPIRDTQCFIGVRIELDTFYILVFDPALAFEIEPESRRQHDTESIEESAEIPVSHEYRQRDLLFGIHRSSIQNRMNGLKPFRITGSQYIQYYAVREMVVL